MGQPSHPNGTRVNSMQVADISLGWLGSEKANYTQAYLTSIFFKKTRHWLNAGLLIPYNNIWTDFKNTCVIKFRSRRSVKLSKYANKIFPEITWDNNVPLSLRWGTERHFFDSIVIRYFKQRLPRLILRDSVEDLIRPFTYFRRSRYMFTYWNRPRMLRVTKKAFHVVRGLGVGDKTPKPKIGRAWKRILRARGFWKYLIKLGKGFLKKFIKTKVTF